MVSAWSVIDHYCDHKLMHQGDTVLSWCWLSDGCQMGVRFVTAQSTRHMHYTMTCLNGDCVVLVTITVTTDSYTREALCFYQWVSDLSRLSPQETGTVQ